MARILIEDASQPDDEHMEGWAYKLLGNDLTAPSQVHIVLGTGAYPKTTTHRKSVGAITVRSLEEEFIHVLAHELRHIDQFWAPQPPPYHYEKDAESFALQVLLEFRRSSRLRKPHRDHGKKLTKRTKHN